MEASVHALHFANLIAVALLAGGQLFLLMTVLPARRGWSAETAVRVHQEALITRPERYLNPAASPAS